MHHSLVAAIAVGAMVLHPQSASAHIREVAAYGPWTLFEGTPVRDTGQPDPFMCGVGIERSVSGVHRSLSFAQARGSTTLWVTMWNGSILMGEPVPDHLSIGFDDRGQVSATGTRVFAHSAFEVQDARQLINLISTSTTMHVTTDAAPPLTADLDGAADAIAAMQRCVAGEAARLP